MSRIFSRTRAPVMVSAAASLLLSMSGGTATAATEPADRDSRSSLIVQSISASVADTADVGVTGYGTVDNFRWLWLTFPVPGNAEACTSRRVYLMAANYHWYNWHDFRNFSNHNARLYQNNTDRVIYLAAGWYFWKDCIGHSNYTAYYHDSYVRQESTGGYAHLDRAVFWSSDPVNVETMFMSSLMLLPS